MQLVINGAPRQVSENLSITELLVTLAIQGRLAVEVNGEIVPRSGFSAYYLTANDTVEIVKAIGGG